MALTDSFIKRDETNIIKGVAIILMLFHHLFTIPSWWISSVAEHYSGFNYEIFANSAKICVPIFAFLTGFFYFYTKRKCFAYSAKKITDLWISYLFVLIVMIIIVFVFKIDVDELSVKRIILELLAVSNKFVVFNWYIIFYAAVMLIMPLFSKLSEKSGFLALAICVLVPTALDFFLRNIEIASFSRIADFVEYLFYFPCVAFGFFFAKYNVFDSMNKFFELKKKAVCAACYALLLVLCFFARGIYPSFDYIYAPVFVFGLLSLIKMVKVKQIFLPLTVLGKYSLLIWFIHSAFVNLFRDYTQPILYYPVKPVAVMIWGLIMCLAASFIIDYPVSRTIKLKNKIIRPFNK